MTLSKLAAWLLLAAFGAAAGPAHAQATPERADDLVVMIQTEDRAVAAGIVVGMQQNGLLFILTARHVIEPPGSSGKIQATVEFAQARGRKLQAIMPAVSFNKGLDLAVIAVPAKDAPTAFQTGAPLSFGRASELPRLGEKLRAVGQTGGTPWASTGLVNEVRSSRSTEIVAEGPSVYEGSSGGALIDDEGLIVGVISRGDRGAFTAIPLRIAREQFEEWRLPFTLQDSYGRAYNGEKMDREFFKPRFGSSDRGTGAVWFEYKATIAINAREIQYSTDGIQYFRARNTVNLSLEHGMAPKRLFFKYISLRGKIYGPFEYETGFAEMGIRKLIEVHHRPQFGNTVLLKAQEDNSFDAVVAIRNTVVSIHPLIIEPMKSFRVDFGDGFFVPKEMRIYGGGFDFDLGTELLSYDTGIQKIRVEAIGPTGEKYGPSTFVIDFENLLKSAWTTGMKEGKLLGCGPYPSTPTVCTPAGWSEGVRWSGVRRVEAGFSPNMLDRTADVAATFRELIEQKSGGSTRWQHRLHTCWEAGPECPFFIRVDDKRSHVYVRYQLFDGRWTDIQKVSIR